MITIEIDNAKKCYIISKNTIPFGHFLIDYLELNINNFFNELSVTEKHGYNSLGNEYYHAEVSLEHQQHMEELFPPYVTSVILHHSMEQINTMGRSKIRPTLEEAKKMLLDEYTLIRNELLKVLFDPNGSDWFDLYEVRAYFGFKKESGTPYAFYGIDNINALVAIELFNIKANEIAIKSCENCGHYFIPSKRSDEIYCDRIYKNGKTCKEVGYAEKEKKDPIKNLYTTARKTQHARIRYNSHIPDYKEKHFEPWKKAAEEARDHFQKTNDVAGFKKWLEDNKNKY